nr:MAG TPA: Transcription initiation factor IIE, alpha FINGER, Transcription [Caudoviricetes sp.]
MSRYIDAEKIKYTEYINGDVTVSKDLVEKIPTADVQEVRHGKWGKSLFAQDFFRCSLCSSVWNRKFEYCPHCGAKMDEEERE